jgi:hypothetical protein
MAKPIGNRGRGSADIHSRSDSFKPVMACSVEQVTQSDDTGSLSGEINCQPGTRATENANDGVQFPAAALQVLASYRKIRRTKRRICGE